MSADDPNDRDKTLPEWERLGRWSAAQLGAFVRERRKAGRMTQEELGEMAGVGTRFVSELERGKPTLRMDVVSKVLYVFGRMLGHDVAPRYDFE